MHPKRLNFVRLLAVTLAVLSAMENALAQSAPIETAQPASANIAQPMPAPKTGTPLHAAEAPPLRSLFYTQEEIASILYALNIYLNRSTKENSKEAEDFLSQLESREASNTEPSKKDYTYPQFFLASLVYHSTSDWAVWINSQKITAKIPPGGVGSVRVLDIDKDKVSFEWKPSARDFEKMKEMSDKAKDERIDVDYLNGIVTFVLRPNQTFSTYAMQVLEGNVEPVTIENKNTSIPPAAQQNQATQVPAPMPIPVPASAANPATRPPGTELIDKSHPPGTP